MLNNTRFGRHVYAIGGNETAARVSGMNISRTKILIYMFSGLMAGLGGVVLSARIAVGDPGAGHRLRARRHRRRRHRRHQLRRRHRHGLGHRRRRAHHRRDEQRPRPAERVAVLPAGRQGRDHRRRDHHRRAQEPLIPGRDAAVTRSSGSGPRPTRGASGSRGPTRSRRRGALPRRGPAQAGYRYSELGPYGYLPTDPGVVRDEYAKRGLTLTGGTVFAALHKGAERSSRRRPTVTRRWPRSARSAPATWSSCPRATRTSTATLTASPDPDRRRVDGPHRRGCPSSAGTSPTRHGAVLVFHTHADSHVGHAGRDRALPRRHRSRGRPPVPRHRARRRTAAPTTSRSSATTRNASATSTSSRSTRRSGGASHDERLGFAPGGAPRRDGRAARSASRTCRPSRGAGGPRSGAVLHRRAGHVPLRLRRAAPDRRRARSEYFATRLRRCEHRAASTDRAG